MIMKTNQVYPGALLLVLLVAGCLTTHGQMLPSSSLLNKPKDIVYDPVRKCTYISNYNGDNILKMDSAGLMEILCESINSPMGLSLQHDTLIISSNLPSKITAIQVETGTVLYELAVPGALYLAMMDYDPRTGLIYIIDQQGMVFKLNYQTQSCTVFVPLNAGIYFGSQSLEVDTTQNRLLVFKWNTGFIRAVNLNDSLLVSNAAPQGISQIQSSESGPDGEIYISSYTSNGIYRYSSNLSGGPVLISANHAAPSGIAYNPDLKFLYVCSYEGNRIDTVPLAVSGSIDNPRVAHPRIFPNPVMETCHITFDSAHQTSVTITVFDQMGQLAKSDHHNLDRGFCVVDLDLKFLAAGFYLLRIDEVNKQSQTEKLIIVR